MTHHEEKHANKWIAISHTRSQMQHNAHKELIYLLPLIGAFIVMALLPSLLGFSIGMLIAGLVGLIMIKRQEIVSSMIVVRGKPAIIVGLLWVLLAWGGAVLAVLAKILNW